MKRAAIVALGLAVGVVSAGAQPGNPSATIAGRVVDRDGGGLPAVEITIDHTALLTRSNDRGAFQLADVPIGAVVLRARRLGFEPARVELTLAPGERRVVELRVLPLATTFDDADSRGDGAHRYGGFYERMGKLAGVFLTRADIERWGPARISDVFRHIDGLRVVTDSGGRASVVEGGAPAGAPACPLRYYVDGKLFFLSDDIGVDSLADIEAVAAIEIYSGRAAVPPRFVWGDTKCGAIALWTREPRVRP